MRASIANTRMVSCEIVRKWDSRVVEGALWPGGGEKREAVFVAGVEKWWSVREKLEGRRDSRRTAIAERGLEEEAAAAAGDGNGNGAGDGDTGDAIWADGNRRDVRRKMEMEMMNE